LAFTSAAFRCRCSLQFNSINWAPESFKNAIFLKPKAKRRFAPQFFGGTPCRRYLSWALAKNICRPAFPLFGCRIAG